MKKMNRAERRRFKKAAMQNKISGEAVDAYFNAMSESPTIQSGDKVKIDVDGITKRKDWNKLNPKYKEFVLDNKDTVFTANTENGALIGLDEEPTWLFLSMDLIKVEEETDEI